MCVLLRGLVSGTESNNMTSEAGHHGGGSRLYPNQDQCSVKIKAARENVLSRLRALFQILSSICFCKKLLFLCTMAFMLTHAHGEEQTGFCKLMDPATIWDISSVVNPETPSRATVKVVVVMVLAIFGGIGLVGLAGWMLYKHRRAFTEDDINTGLMRGPAVVRQSDSKFKIPQSIE